MLGQLNPDQIEALLKSEVLGRIGCSANGIVYVVPVTYTTMEAMYTPIPHLE
jgi:nitroimidazol reductase NimA-like FMN-containing flavoprotein (pyridoxamine 5'-phosphate oxidase superfamily)